MLARHGERDESPGFCTHSSKCATNLGSDRNYLSGVTKGMRKENKMMKRLIDGKKKVARIVVLFILTATFPGCASHKVADVKEEEPGRILHLRINENSESVDITVTGNKYLSYSAFTQNSPKGVLFNFSNTTLKNIKPLYTPSNNEIISSIATNELIDDKTIKSSIFIALKKDASYDVTPLEEGLQISFPKSDEISKDDALPQEFAKKKPESKKPSISVPAATRLEDVTVTSHEENVIVNIKANGVIRDYESFNLKNPARIVFDMYNLKSAYENEQKIAVSSKWVNQVRHYSHPDKVRLVLDASQVASYDSTLMESGLQISFPEIGSAITPVSELAETELRDVTVAVLQNNLSVNIKTDGEIKDYESFTLDDPPRIVFDIYNINSPHQNEQIITVESKWVTRVRHCGHLDKVRLVLDTYRDYLSKYAASPTDNGLLIQVGIIPTAKPDTFQ
jgi:type IV pilus assembly protein PilQ